MDESYFDNGNPLQNTTFLFKKKEAPTIKNNFFLKVHTLQPFCCASCNSINSNSPRTLHICL